MNILDLLPAAAPVPDGSVQTPTWVSVLALVVVPIVLALLTYAGIRARNRKPSPETNLRATLQEYDDRFDKQDKKFEILGRQQRVMISGFDGLYQAIGRTQGIPPLRYINQEKQHVEAAVALVYGPEDWPTEVKQATPIA